MLAALRTQGPLPSVASALGAACVNLIVQTIHDISWYKVVCMSIRLLSKSSKTDEIAASGIAPNFALNGGLIEKDEIGDHHVELRRDCH
jgi:hypothetical protein